MIARGQLNGKFLNSCRDKLSGSTEAGLNLLKSSETDRRNDALAVQKAFTTSGKV